MANPNPPPIELTDEQKAIVETDEDTIVISFHSQVYPEVHE